MTKTAENVGTVKVVLARDWFGPGGELRLKDVPFEWPADDVDTLPSDATVDGKVLRKSVDLFNQAGRQSAVREAASDPEAQERLDAALARAKKAEAEAADFKAKFEQAEKERNAANEAKEKTAEELLKAKKPEEPEEPTKPKKLDL